MYLNVYQPQLQSERQAAVLDPAPEEIRYFEQAGH
jgi:hypothetical protein